MANAKAANKPAAVVASSQDHICAGPQLSAAERPLALTPTASTARLSQTRWLGLCKTPKPSKQGTSKPVITQASAAPALSGIALIVGKRCWNCAPSNQCAPRPSKATAKSCKPLHTWPRPNGTAEGNSKAAGQLSSKTSTPRDWGASQRLCQRSQRAKPPWRATYRASSAPAIVPRVLSNQSSREATRCGK